MTDPSQVHTARDPVCGMTVQREQAKASVEYSGETYYFCCGGCAEKFKADPQRYLNAPKPNAGLVALGASTAGHAELTSSGLVGIAASAKPATARDPVC